MFYFIILGSHHKNRKVLREKTVTTFLSKISILMIYFIFQRTNSINEKF